MSTSPLGTRALKFKVGTTEFNADAKNVEITSDEADSDFVTFAQAAAGGARDYKLKFVATQDPGDATSLWSLLFASAGSTVAVVVNPYGVATFTAAQPGFSGNVVIKEPDGTLLGGDADASTTSRFEIECEWPFTAKPTKLVTGTY
ncbi:MAG: hypothetical protein ACRCY8_06685 [Dermatophilaceae bacterium]